MKCIICGEELTKEAELAELIEKREEAEEAVDNPDAYGGKLVHRDRLGVVREIVEEIKMLYEREDELCQDCDKIIGKIVEKKIARIGIEEKINGIIGILQNARLI